MSTTGDNKGKYPIKIKVNFKVRESGGTRYVVRRYHISPEQVFCKEDDFKKRRHDPAVIIAHAKAVDLFRKGLSIEEFERMYTGSGAMDEIKTVFDSICQSLRNEGRDGTAEAYGHALASFVAYKGEHITFGSVTVEWLKGYERWMLTPRTVGEGKKKRVITHTINTVGMYCRALRTIFNYAIDRKIIAPDVFPFGLRKYVIPQAPRQTRKAFTREEKNVILAHRSEREDVNRALDIWAYLFFSSGCNFADFAYLKWKDIEGDFLYFNRKKTENTERMKERITVSISPRMREVITRHGTRSLDPDAYVFPVLNLTMSSKQRKDVIREAIKGTNELLVLAQDEINAEREKAGLKPLAVKLTTGTARYTAATLLKKHGIDLQVIAKALGHGSEATTEHYTEEDRETQVLISKTLAL